MRAAARPLAATTAAAAVLPQRHRRRRRRRRIVLDPKPLAARARHVRVTVQGNPGEFVQVRPPPPTTRRSFPATRAFQISRRQAVEPSCRRLVFVSRDKGCKFAFGKTGFASYGFKILSIVKTIYSEIRRSK